MAEFTRPESEEDFHQNFAQIKPLMNQTEAFYESSRCLFCFDAPCVNACPTGIDIPLFIRQINSGNEMGSAKTIYDANYFGNICGKVCPTDVLCEGACVFNHQNVKPIEIGRLQSFATSKAIKEDKKLFSLKAENGKKIAIIGAGPAGISCACELRTLGYKVDIYEAKSEPSGLTVYGVAPYKIKNEDALEEVSYLKSQFGFEIFFNEAIDTKEKITKLGQDYDCLFLGIGLGATSSLNIPGERLQNCFGAVEFIEELKIDKHNTRKARKVVVLGGGNTSMDAASESSRMGAQQVILAYRRSNDEKGAYEFEYDLAKEVGVRGLFNVSPVEIMGEKSVEGVKFIRTKTEKGKLVTIPGSEFIESCDMVIKATGQNKKSEFLSLIEGLDLDEKNRIKVDPDTFQTTNPKFFAAGDAVNGGIEVVNAVAEAKVAAKGIDRYLSSN